MAVAWGNQKGRKEATNQASQAKQSTSNRAVDRVVETSQDQGGQEDGKDFHVVLVNSLSRIVFQYLLGR